MADGRAPPGAGGNPPAAQATLSEALGVRDVLTLDRRGFRTYRTRAGKALRLVLDEGVA